MLLHHASLLRDMVFFSCLLCLQYRLLLILYTILYCSVCSVKTVYGTQNTCKSHRGEPHIGGTLLPPLCEVLGVWATKVVCVVLVLTVILCFPADGGCTVYCVYCVLCTVCTVYCVQCTVYCVLCTVYCVLCTVYCVLCTVYCVLCTVYCVLCTVYCVLCTVYCVLCRTALRICFPWSEAPYR